MPHCCCRGGRHALVTEHGASAHQDSHQARVVSPRAGADRLTHGVRQPRDKGARQRPVWQAAKKLGQTPQVREVNVCRLSRLQAPRRECLIGRVLIQRKRRIQRAPHRDQRAPAVGRQLGPHRKGAARQPQRQDGLHRHSAQLAQHLRSREPLHHVLAPIIFGNKPHVK